MRIDPATAVPRDAPRLVMVFCTPPTTSVSSSGTAETVTAPSWPGGERADAEPGEQQRDGDDLRARPSSAAMSDTMPSSIAARPQRTTSRGAAVGKNRGIRRRSAGTPTTGSSRTPVWRRDSPSAMDRSGTTKNNPASSTGRELRSARGPYPRVPQVRTYQELSSRSEDATLPGEEQPDHHAGEHQPDRRRQPDDGPPAREDPPPLPGPQHAEDGRPRQGGPDANRASGSVLRLRVSARIPTTSTTSPRTRTARSSRW